MTPTIYINLEDDVASIAARIQRQRSEQVVLVCPKRCFLFSDPINLKLLKTQTDIFGKEVFILTMDEKGRAYAEAAGFGLRQVPGAPKTSSVSDIKRSVKEESPVRPEQKRQNLISNVAKEVENFAKSFVSPAESLEPEPEVSQLEPKVSASNEAFVEKEKAADVIPDAVVKDTIFPKEIEESIRMEKKSKHNRRVAVALLGGAVCLVLLLIFVVLPRAEVVVYPRTEPVTRDLEITMGSDVKASDVDKLLLSATKDSESLDVSDSFQSQGKKQVGNKATGTVKIYNFTKASINLKSATTVLTINGKTYTLVPDLVTVKPTRYANAATKEIDPSSLGDSIDVVASEGGEASNLPAGTRIEITNQVFGSKPQLLYAKTDTPITGGVSRYLSVISDQDITAAQNALKQKLLSQVQSELSAKGLKFLDNSYTLEVANFTTDKPVNTESPNFTAHLSAKVTWLAFNEKDLADLIAQRTKESISDDKSLESDPTTPNSYRIKTVDFNAGLAVIAAHFQGHAVNTVDVKSLPKKLVGKTPTEVNEILTSMPEIDRIDVTLAPSWQKTFPFFAKKITVKVQE